MNETVELRGTISYENNIVINLYDIIGRSLDEVAKVLEKAIEENLDRNLIEKKSIYVITYECGKEIKQEKLIAEPVSELVDLINEVTFLGFRNINGKVIYIKTANIIEIREYDDDKKKVVLT